MRPQKKTATTDNTSDDDTVPLLLGDESLGYQQQTALDRFDDEMNDRQHYADGPLPEVHVASILKTFGTVDLDLAKQVLKLRDIDTLRAAYFRQGRALLSTRNGQKSKGSEFEALTAAFEILSNPFWFRQFQEVREAERKDPLADAVQPTNTSLGKGASGSAAFDIFGASEQDPFLSTGGTDAFSNDWVSNTNTLGTGAAVITPPTSPSEFEANFPSGAPENIILHDHDWTQPQCTVKPKPRKKMVQFNLDSISELGKENDQSHQEETVTKSSVTGKESLLDRDLPIESASGDDTGSANCSAMIFKDPQEFMAHVQNVVSEAFETVSTSIPEDAAKASAAVEAYMKEFSAQLSATGNRISVGAADVHKSVMGTMAIPDEKVERMLSVLSLENFQFQEAFEHAEKEFNDASSKIQQKFSWS